MAIKIGKKITGYSVMKPEDRVAAKPVAAEIIQMHEKLERPETLEGSTYKIKSPLFEHALYVTINDVILNPGTAHELRRPFEIFINSKNMDHFQWIVALTRIMSAVFRKGGDVNFLVEELKAVFDPRGGYFKSGGVYMSSIVAEIGAVIEQHMKMIGLLVDDELSDAQRDLIEQKRAEFAERSAQRAEAATAAEADSGDFPASSSVCAKCNTKAVIVMDGCETCLNCGHSKCG